MCSSSTGLTGGNSFFLRRSVTAQDNRPNVKTMDAKEVLAGGVESIKMLTGRFLAGFDDGNRTAQAPMMPNHAAWTLGHVALYLNAIANDLDGKGMPGEGYAKGGGEEVFDQEYIAFGSTPECDAGRYPPYARCVEILHKACDRLAAAVRGASDEALSRMVKFGPFDVPLYSMVTFMIFHCGFHTGQIADLRRGLGMDRVLGDIARTGGPRKV